MNLINFCFGFLIVSFRTYDATRGGSIANFRHLRPSETPKRPVKMCVMEIPTILMKEVEEEHRQAATELDHSQFGATVSLASVVGLVWFVLMIAKYAL